jgi:hypothetical protein
MFSLENLITCKTKVWVEDNAKTSVYFIEIDCGHANRIEMSQNIVSFLTIVNFCGEGNAIFYSIATENFYNKSIPLTK